MHDVRYRTIYDTARYTIQYGIDDIRYTIHDTIRYTGYDIRYGTIYDTWYTVSDTS